jgi:hypothetical protein
MSDFDEFERQLNENKQGEGTGVIWRRRGWLLASLPVSPAIFSSRPPLQGRAVSHLPPVRGARLAHVIAAFCRARRGKGWLVCVAHARGSGPRPRGPDGGGAVDPALARQASTRSFFFFLFFGKEMKLCPVIPSFSPAALALPLPVGRQASSPRPLCFQNGGVEYSFSFPPSRGRGTAVCLPAPAGRRSLSYSFSYITWELPPPGRCVPEPAVRRIR